MNRAELIAKLRDVTPFNSDDRILFDAAADMLEADGNPLTDEDICKIAIEEGHATEIEGYPNNTLWFDGNLIDFARTIEAHIRGEKSGN